MHETKRLAVTIAGFGLLAMGAALMVLPGPGILLIVAGLAVLATEYVWARALLVRAKKEAKRVQEAAVASPTRTAGSVIFACVLGGLGLVMLIIDEMSWPIIDALLDKVWGPLTGTLLMLTGVILLTATVITRMTAKREATAHAPKPR